MLIIAIHLLYFVLVILQLLQIQLKVTLTDEYEYPTFLE